MTEEEKVSRRYRELPREEPPRHLDDAIRAAARRAVHTRPAPLVVPTGRQRWYFPLAAAAIIVLAVAVTMHVEREQPGEEIVSSQGTPAEEVKAEKPQSAPQPERRRKAESADSRELRDAAPPPELQKAPEPAAPPVATQDAIRGAEESAAGARAESARAPAAPQANAQLGRADEGRRAASLSAFALQSPEQWLQGIADLRRQGRHEEADKSLAEFRKRYPDYRISKEALEQLEKR
jgi:type IV secretory pathway VirB10-like protein